MSTCLASDTARYIFSFRSSFPLPGSIKIKQYSYTPNSIYCSREISKTRNNQKDSPFFNRSGIREEGNSKSKKHNCCILSPHTNATTTPGIRVRLLPDTDCRITTGATARSNTKSLCRVKGGMLKQRSETQAAQNKASEDGGHSAGRPHEPGPTPLPIRSPNAYLLSKHPCKRSLQDVPDASAPAVPAPGPGRTTKRTCTRGSQGPALLKRGGRREQGAAEPPGSSPSSGELRTRDERRTEATAEQR